MKVLLLWAWIGSLLAFPATGLEVDPYLAWLVDIPDSSAPLNLFTNAAISGHLQALGESGRAPEACPAVAMSALKHLHSSVLGRRRAMHFVQTSPAIANWKDGGGWASVWRSYYRRLPFLYFSSLARTIDVNGVRLSVDKIGHFFGFGRRYYRRYLREVANGQTPEAAERAVILHGVRQENLQVGKWVSTIFSHADLEANYQGMRFARDLCEGEAPYLRQVEGTWSLERDIDLRDYVTPGFDEGYNSNHFTRLGWWLVRARLGGYCSLLEEPRVRRRLEYYRDFGQPSASQRLLLEMFESRGKDPQRRHSLERLCADQMRRRAGIETPRSGLGPSGSTRAQE